MPKTGSRAMLARLTLTAAAVVGAALPAVSSAAALRPLPPGVDAARLDAPVRDVRAPDADTRAYYLVRLRQAPVSRGAALGDVDAEHTAFRLDRLARMRGVKVVSELRMALNGFVVEATAADAQSLRDDPRVLRVSRVRDYEMHLGDAVPWIGASALQALGIDGEGVRVAILDSGVDYTHAAFGGPGTLEAHEAAWGTSVDDPRNTERDDLFPTERVVDGFDFVGENWVSGEPVVPDPDPIGGPSTETAFAFHGTLVADITAGAEGVAPAADIIAVKVCATLSSSCSGVALINAMDYVLDPNGDGDMDDRVDIVNMSLGSIYGQPFDDDLAAAVENATAAGVLTVASAGNSGDRPYVTGTPAAAPTALSVAATENPSTLTVPQMTIDGEGDVDAIFQTWSAELTETISGVVQYGDGEGGALNGCSLDPDNPTESNPFPPGSLDGKIVMVDRGACFFSEKIFNIGQAGGILGIIAQNTDDPPFPGGFGDNTPEPEIPGYMISLAAGDLLRNNDTLVTFDPANVRIATQATTTFSSRGPQGFDNRIKPEIAAPGVITGAASGTGTGVLTSQGTSFSAPMVAGAAALMLDAFPGQTPLQIKQRLINGAETGIENELASGVLAPITRIGGGEVRVDRSNELPAVAYQANDPAGGGLSFGIVRAARETTTRILPLAVENQSDAAVTYTVNPTFRYADDAESGAVTVEAPASIAVAAGQKVTFPVRVRINPANLPDNAMDSGINGNNPGPLTTQEVDGYLELVAEDHTLRLPWQVLPLKAAHTVPDSFTFTVDNGSASVGLTNFGFGTSQPDVFSLLATSEDIPEGELGEQAPTPDLRAVGVATFADPNCESGFLWAFGFNAWEAERHLFPVLFQVTLDVDRDGTDDFAVYNADLDLNSFIGQEVTYAENLETGETTIFFFTLHSMNSGNAQLLVCGEQVGLGADDVGATAVDARFEAIDFYFGGPGDLIDGITITPGGEQYVGFSEDIPGRSQGILQITDNGKLESNTQELGVMVLTDGLRALPGAASRRTEALLLEAAE